MTPFRTGSSLSEQEMKFNEVHQKAWNTVAKAIAALKNTFRCLLGPKQLYYKPEKAAQIIHACIALHNLRIKHKMPLDFPESSIEDEAELLENNETDVIAVRLRERIMYGIT